MATEGELSVVLVPHGGLRPGAPGAGFPREILAGLAAHAPLDVLPAWPHPLPLPMVCGRSSGRAAGLAATAAAVTSTAPASAPSPSAAPSGPRRVGPMAKDPYWQGTRSWKASRTSKQALSTPKALRPESWARAPPPFSPLLPDHSLFPDSSPSIPPVTLVPLVILDPSSL